MTNGPTLHDDRLVRVRTMPACIVLLAVGLLYAAPALALCATPKEAGHWLNTDLKQDPYSIDIVLMDCGDQVLNGVPTESKYRVGVTVAQSSGALFQRPRVEGKPRTSQGVGWIFAKVPTGGYVDEMWMRTIDVKGTTRLYVYILHKSLDSKPDATSRLWFNRSKKLQIHPH